MSDTVDSKKLEIPPNERISPIRAEDMRQKAPGNTCCLKCGSDRIHISQGGTRSMSLLSRLFLVVYRCHTCGTLSRHAKLIHWIRRLFGSAKSASMNVLDREPMIDSQASEFKPVKPDRNPVFREKVVEGEMLHLVIEPSFDPDPIVTEIKSNYTASQRELLASKFQEIAYLITPPMPSSKPDTNQPDSESENPKEI